MNSYSRLLNTLKEQGSQVQNTTFEVTSEKFKSAQSFCTSKILDVLTWSLNLEDNNFKLLSPHYAFNIISTNNFKSFLHSNRSCFEDYFIEIFDSYHQFLLTQRIHGNNDTSEYCLQYFLPFRLDNSGYHFVTLYIMPEVINNIIVKFYFVIIPLKKCSNEAISFQIIKNQACDLTATDYVKNKIKVPRHINLTKDQAEIFSLLLYGYSSKKISVLLNKNQENILKYNIRIKDRLSSFFEVKFNTVMDAAQYYTNCFVMDQSVTMRTRIQDIMKYY